jgi:hypothetical protein
MPGHAYHTRKKKHDFEASKLIHDSSQGSAFADWEIVTLFYSALHYVDCYLDRAHSIDPNGHGGLGGRKDYIIDLLPEIESDYRLLRALSEDARYHDVPIQQPELTRATRSYDQIKHSLTPVTCADCGQENLINRGKCEICKLPL